jgi:hypothetical protein
MLSVSVSEQVKFKSKKCGTVTVLPVTGIKLTYFHIKPEKFSK